MLKCFDDPESKVRYHACESVYNVCKAMRKHCLEHFCILFDGLCKLYSDVEVEVKNGAQLLDRLLKDIVVECYIVLSDDMVVMFERYLRMTNPYIRQLLLSWIVVLCGVPGVDMVKHLPRFLNGIFNMLSDGNVYIRQSADKCLNEFLQEIQHNATTNRKQDNTTLDNAIQDNTRLDKITAEQEHLSQMIPTLVGQSLSAYKFPRLVSIQWLLAFTEVLSCSVLCPLLHEVLCAVLYCLDDAEEEIRNLVVELESLVEQKVKKCQREHLRYVFCCCCVAPVSC